MHSIHQLIDDKNVPEGILSAEEIFFQLIGNKHISGFLDRNKISLEEARKYISKLHEYVIAMKNVETDGYEPMLIIDNGQIDVTYKKSIARIEREREIREQGNISNSTMPLEVRKASFKEMFKTEKRVALMKEVKAFMKAFNDDPFALHKGLFVCGRYGTGKTYIMGAMANALAKKNFKTRIEHYPTMLTRLKDMIKSDTVGSEINRIKSAKVLILDDVGAEKLTEWVRDEVFIVILEYRMANHLPTFFTSNLTMEQFEDFLARTKEGVDHRKAQRIMERVKFLSREIELEGINRRQEGSNG